jgi:2,3-dihydroxy-p-cumate/2,3-dihydroxybenzoate 3,4-dioxygenase
MQPKVRYRRLSYVELNVSDLARSKAFYENMIGLQFVGKGPSGELRFRCSEDPYTVVLHQGPSPGHKRTGLMLEDDRQFEHLFARLRAAGVAWEELSATECAERGFVRAARTVDPFTGAVMEFIVSASTQPSVFTPTLAKIQRLGHVVWGTPKLDEALAHFRDVLNFEPSDYIKGFFGFFHCWPNPWHHGVALGRAPAPVYHHTNFMVSEIDDIGRAIHRLNRAGVPIVYGPGRHLASGSAFLYFLDPDGLTCEYSFGMEQFPEEGAREPRLLEPTPEVADIWLSPRDPRMGSTGVIESYSIKPTALA